MENSPIKEIRIPDGGMETILPGFPSYYEDINAIMSIIKYISLGLLISLIIFIIIKKVQNKSISKKIIITSVILLIITILASFIRMPYWT